MFRFAILLVLATVHITSAAEDQALPVRSGKTSAELRVEIQARAPRLLSPDRLPVDFAEFNRPGRSVFLAWYCPTSGEATCRVYSYEYHAEKKEWRLLREQFFHGTQDVTVEFPLDLRLRLLDVRGKEIYREPAPKE